MFEVCTDERRYGPVRVQAPYLMRSEDGQGRGGGNEQHYTATFRNIPHPRRQALSTFSLDVEDVPAAGSRPDHLAGVRPQEERVLRHTVEHIVDFVRFAPMVQVLDEPAPQMVEQLPDVLKFFDALTPVPEQVIEVPKIFADDVPVRTSVRDTQLRLWRFPPRSHSCSSLRKRFFPEGLTVLFTQDLCEFGHCP